MVWLLQIPAPLPLEVQSWERRPLDGVEQALALPALPPNLVPRAAAVMPALLQLLRQPEASLQEMVSKVQRDTLLTTEVLRMARSPLYGTEQTVDSRETAISRIGVSGLQSAMAKVVLKPLFSAQTTGLTGRAGPRIWIHAERQAQQAMALADATGLDRFDGFLVGPLHGAGRTAVLRLLDRQGMQLQWPWSLAFDQALQLAGHRLFGRLLMEWAISPSLTALGQALTQYPLQIEPASLEWIAIESERLTTASLTPRH